MNTNKSTTDKTVKTEAAVVKKEEAKATPKATVKKPVAAKTAAAKTAAAKPAAAKPAAAKPAAAKPAAAKKTTTVKKTTTARKTTATKPAVRKTAAKKTPDVKIAVQFADKNYTMEDFTKIAKDVWVYDYGKDLADLKDVQLYVKPEESKAYYVFNDTITGAFDI